MGGDYPSVHESYKNILPLQVQLKSETLKKTLFKMAVDTTDVVPSPAVSHLPHSEPVLPCLQASSEQAGDLLLLIDSLQEIGMVTMKLE